MPSISFALPFQTIYIILIIPIYIAKVTRLAVPIVTLNWPGTIFFGMSWQSRCIVLPLANQLGISKE